MPHFQTLRRIEDGKPIAANHNGPCGLTVWNTWDWISGVIADEFNCSPDDVETIETDAGDIITACGNPVAYFDDGYGNADFVGLNAAAFPFLEAAE